jgi:hypothetical protein
VRRFSAGRFQPTACGQKHYESQVVAALRLDLEKIRAAFRAF